jgi:cytochrome c-type biogenesis protein CcmH/NrfF
MPKKKTHQEFVKQVCDLVGDEYEFLTNYVSSRIKVKVKHKKCDYVWETNPKGLIEGLQRHKGVPVCPNCSDAKKTTEQFKQEVYEIFGKEYEVLGEYVDYNTKTKVKHNLCDNEYEVTPSTILSGCGCPNCRGKRISNSKRKTHDQFIKEVFELVGNEYTVLTKYTRSRDSVKMKHNICNHEWFVEANSFLVTGSRCPECAKKIIGDKNRKSHEKFVQEVYELVGTDYSVIGIYQSDNENIKIIHNICEFEYKVKPSNFLQGSRCPHCKSSKGEKKIKEYLSNNNIKFEPQYRFSDCKDRYTLPFDFAMLNDNQRIKLLIEYDGQGHFYPISYSKNENDNIKNFEETKRHDQIKNQYCKNKNIHLYRIPYWKFDEIEDILNKLIHDEYVEVNENFIIQ